MREDAVARQRWLAVWSRLDERAVLLRDGASAQLEYRRPDASVRKLIVLDGGLDERSLIDRGHELAVADGFDVLPRGAW